jgi:CheY-like chemotaxis protein
VLDALRDAAQRLDSPRKGAFIRGDSPRDDNLATRGEQRMALMKTIVVVDDEYGLADVLASTFFDIGYTVHTAANGVQGLEVMAEHPPDLVILDFTMPLLDGAGVLTAMRGDPALSAVPVVGMRCSGYVAFLRKPFDFDAILGAVRGSLGESE